MMHFRFLVEFNYKVHRQFLAVLLLLIAFQTNAQEDILIARQRPVGSVVTIQGISTNGSELGAIRYIQDPTASIAVYPGGSSPSAFEQVTTGDEVQVTGVLSMYHGLLEINPILSFQKISSGNSLADPLEIDPAKLTFHDQGKLLRLKCVRFSHSPGAFESGNISVYTSSGFKGQLYFEGNHPLLNSSLPDTSVDLVVIASYFDTPRFLIRNAGDIIPSLCFHILPTPVQSEITQDGFRLEWTSSEPSQGFCILTDELSKKSIIPTQFQSPSQELLISDLVPAEFYLVQVGGINQDGDTALYAPIPMSTKSMSSGDISIIFNQSIDASFSNGSTPAGTTYSAMLSSIFDLIDAAQSTIDVAMYNSNRPDIISALEEALDRGVNVRYIGDGGQSNSALDPLPEFPLLFRNGDGIMHHKFIIVDPHDPALATVWTGSTNHSTGQLSTDPNNAIVIQDQSLAKAYLMEFEEMWGGSGNAPNPLASRTGSAKHDDTPHLFQVGDVLMENYFSPSDNTNKAILDELDASEESISVALLLLTRTDLSEAMAQTVQQGTYVRVIVDDLESSLSSLEILNDGGALTAHHEYSSIFHHKYAVIDEGTTTARVITGSHNWTTSATVRNDENTLILHDADITNLYRQEFEARWKEVYSTGTRGPSEGIVNVYPNPSSNFVRIESEKPVRSIELFTTAGVLLSRGTSENHIDVRALPEGMYFLICERTDGSIVNAVFVKAR